MNDEVKQFKSLLDGECVWQLPPYLWNTNEMKEMIERVNNGEI